LNLNELFEFLKTKHARWTSSNELLVTFALDRESHDFLTQHFGKVVKKFRLDREHKLRQPTEISTKMYGKREVICHIETKNNSVSPIYQSIENLANGHPIDPPTKFIIFNADKDDLAYDKDHNIVVEGKVKHYLEISDFWNHLRNNAEDHTPNSLTFLYRKKLKISARYDVRLLKKEYGGLSRFKRILEDLSEEAHKDAKPHILQNALLACLYEINEAERFKYLLENFDKFTKKFDDGYHAYVVGFSFDDLRKEYEERYREYMVKINDLISSSLTKALMIPGVLYLTATRTQAIVTSKGLANSYESLVVNLGIAVAAIIVFMIYWCILCNEKKSLGSIRDEFVSLMNRLEEKSPQALTAIKTFKDNIDERLISGHKTIEVLLIANIASLIASLSWVAIRTFQVVS
jgi:hypothetical protein